jgi:3-hydroxyisobutyrate dehydrogenase
VRVGFIGLGRMGKPVCANLARAGHEVTAADERDDGRPSSAEVAGGSEVLITMLPGPAEVTDAMIGRGGALQALPDGATWIDMSTASPEVGRTVLARRDVPCLDAPVGGDPEAARSGTLRLFVGGARQVFERHRDLLAVLGEPRHVGAHGAGYTTKLLVNLLWFGHAVASAEALLIGRRGGIDTDVLREALASTDFLREDLDALLAGDYKRNFGIDRCHEELRTITALARELNVPAEVAEVVTEIHGRAVERFGPVDGELLAVALLEEQAGERLRGNT